MGGIEVDWGYVGEVESSFLFVSRSKNVPAPLIYSLDLFSVNVMRSKQSYQKFIQSGTSPSGYEQREFK